MGFLKEGKCLSKQRTRRVSPEMKLLSHWRPGDSSFSRGVGTEARQGCGLEREWEVRTEAASIDFSFEKCSGKGRKERR